MTKLRTTRGSECAQRIYDIISRDDFNPDHATDIRDAVEDALASAPSAPQPTTKEYRHRIAEAASLGVVKNCAIFANLPLNLCYPPIIFALNDANVQPPSASQEEPTQANTIALIEWLRGWIKGRLDAAERDVAACLERERVVSGDGKEHPLLHHFKEYYSGSAGELRLLLGELEALSSSAPAERPLPDNRDLALAIIKRCADYVRGYMVPPPESADWNQRAEWLRWQDCARMLKAQPNAIIATAQHSAAPPDTCDDLCMIPAPAETQEERADERWAEVEAVHWLNTDESLAEIKALDVGKQVIFAADGTAALSIVLSQTNEERVEVGDYVVRFDPAGPVRAMKQDALEALMAARAACLDCGLPYSEFPLDVVLPRAQWLEIHPDENGLICAQCIVKRAAKVRGVTCVHAILEIAPHGNPREAQPSPETPATTSDVCEGCANGWPLLTPTHEELGVPRWHARPEGGWVQQCGPRHKPEPPPFPAVTPSKGKEGR